VNLLQTLMETLFFYHPALWWISARMRAEREFCCDDFAIEQCGCPIHLARALLELQNLGVRPAAPTPLPSAAGELKTRIERLYTMKENAMDLREKMVAMVVLIGLGLVLVPLQGISKAITLSDDHKKKTEKIEVRVEKSGDDEKVVTVTAADSCVDQLDKLILIDTGKGHRHIIQMKDGKAVSVTRDGKEITLDSLKNEMIVQELESWKGDDQPKVFTIETSGDSTHKQVNVRVKKGERNVALWTVQEDEGKTIHLESGTGDSLHRIIHLKVVDESDSTGEHTKAVKKRVTMIGRPETSGQHTTKHDRISEKIRKELLNDGIIKGGGAVEFKLTDKELVVNGIKQSDAAHKKYLKILSKRMGLEDDDRMEVKLNFKE